MGNKQSIDIDIDLGRKRVSFLMESDNSIITLPIGVWNYGAIVSALIRTKYSEDDVEAIINNNIALIATPSSISDEESQAKLDEFKQMQEWREKCKTRAKELLALGKEMGLEEMYG